MDATKSVTFATTVREARANVTGFNIPAEIVAQLGTSKRPPVRVTVAGYTYLSTVAVYGDEFLLPLSLENRTAAGVSAGQEVDLTLELDLAPRKVEVPDDLLAALQEQGGALPAYEALSPSKRKELVRQVNDAKTPETRARRISGIVANVC